jgi:hypothetical protein
MLRLTRHVATALLLCTGCVSNEATGGSGDDPGEVRQTTGSLLPWKVGNTWTYQVTGDGEQTTKVVTLEAEEPVGGAGPNAGKIAIRQVSAKGASDKTISWHAIEGERLVRYREQSFSARTGALEIEEHWSPGKLHIDYSAAHVAAGASWFEEYQETKVEAGATPETSSERERWMVDAVDELVEVPAGKFRALVLQKAGGDSLKTYWFVPGVGKVKETGGQTEVLVRYDLTP